MKKGFIKQILITFVVVVLLIATLSMPQFDWDVFALIQWITGVVWDFVVGSAERVAEMEVFQSIFR